MISGIEHVGLSVADLDRSLAFYRDVLGLELVRLLECGPETQLGKVVGMPGCAARIAHLQSGPMMLELFEYTAPRGEPIAPDRRQADHGFVHLGFTTDDIHADAARLRGHGVRLLSEPVEFRPGVWIVYFRGPDGEVCELRQS